MKPSIKIIIAILTVSLALGISVGLYAKKPKAKKKRAPQSIPIVTAVNLESSTEKIFIEAFGKVIPARKLDLIAEVEGKVTEQNQDLVPGGIIKKGALIVQLDRKDYLLQVAERKAEVAEAQYRLELEKGHRAIAEREWRLFAQETSTLTPNKNLALREPHLKYATTNLEAANSRLEGAEHAASKTTIRAPFDSLVLDEFVEQGQFVGKQKTIATLAATGQFWIQVAIPALNLGRINFDDGKEQRGSSARVILDIGDGEPVIRQAQAFKLLGDLDPKGRMARILLTINDPLGLDGAGQNRILLGSYVKVEISGGNLDNVYVIPRAAMRDNDQLWLLSPDGKLALRDASIKWRRQEDFLVHADIGPEERLIVSRLQTPLPGMQLRTLPARPTP